MLKLKIIKLNKKLILDIINLIIWLRNPIEEFIT